jgi:hypothetical protein
VGACHRLLEVVVEEFVLIVLGRVEMLSASGEDQALSSLEAN